VTFDKQVWKRSVSLTGDVFDPSGTLTGGSRSHSASILAKLGGLSEAEATLRQKEAELQQVERELASIQSEAAK
jgi:structural maintenance of chromosome 2